MDGDYVELCHGEFTLGQVGSVISHAKETVSHYQDGHSNGMKTRMESFQPRTAMARPR
jgi:hypothetical protein